MTEACSAEQKPRGPYTETLEAVDGQEIRNQSKEVLPGPQSEADEVPDGYDRGGCVQPAPQTFPEVKAALQRQRLSQRMDMSQVNFSPLSLPSSPYRTGGKAT